MAKRNIYLLPDRVLILDAAGFGAINYQQLQVEIETFNLYRRRDERAP
jgi:hypothetical protein